MLTKIVEVLGKEDAGRRLELEEALAGRWEPKGEALELLEETRRKWGIEVQMSEAYRLKAIEAGRAECEEACPGLNGCARGGLQDVVTYTTSYGRRVLHYAKSPCERRVAAARAEKLKEQAENAQIPRSALEVQKLKEWQPNVLELYKKNEKEAKNWLYLYGGYGTGKTTLAGYLGLKELERGRRVRFCNVAELIMELHYSQEVAWKMRELWQEDVLILDDLGAEYKTALVVERLFVLIDGRYRARSADKRLIITSNLGLAELEREYGAQGVRIADRIRDRSTQIKIN